MNLYDRVAFVGVAFGSPSAADVVWWWPRGQVPQRVVTLSTTMLVRVLRTGVLADQCNPPFLIDLLLEEFRRRVEGREWMPASLTMEEIDRWTRLPASSAVRC